MNKNTMVIVAITAIIVLMLDTRIRALPGVNMLPTI